MPASETFVAALPHNAVLAISGDDAAAFLHAQFTNDVAALAPGAAQWNGWCSPKGRLLATFLLVRRETDYLLMLPAEIAEPVAKRLRMFVLRSKVKIEDITAKIERYGVAGPGAAAIVEPLRDRAAVAQVDARRFVVLADAPMLEPTAGESAWDASLVQAGIPIVVAATQDAFVPQMANFELVGGVNFKKGCYPGQEIVARTQYRGILKRRMALAHLDTAEAPQPGDSLYSSAFGEQAAGQVANAAPAPQGGFDALVVAQVESLKRGDLRWRAPDGPALEMRELPYTVPA